MSQVRALLRMALSEANNDATIVENAPKVQLGELVDAVAQSMSALRLPLEGARNDLELLQERVDTVVTERNDALHERDAAMEQHSAMQATLSTERAVRGRAETQLEEAQARIAEWQRKHDTVAEASARNQALLDELRGELDSTHQVVQRLTGELKTERSRPAPPAPVRQPAPRVITERPVPPEKIEFEYRRNFSGLLSSVTMRAEGYEDATVDIVRGLDNRMQQLQLRG